MYTNPPRATVDFETRSACSLRACGSWRYSLDPTTQVMCLAFRLPSWAPGRVELWHPAFPHLGIEEECTGGFDALMELFAWVLTDGLVEAHNSWFERGIWTNIMVPQYGFPSVPHTSWRCSAAKAAAHALPRNLEDAGDAVESDIVKDVEGGKVMKKMMKPRKATVADKRAWARLHEPCPVCDGAGRVESFKKDGTPTVKGQKCPVCAGAGHGNADDVPSMPLLYHESADLLAELWAYCRQDVLAEEAVSAALPDLNPLETRMFLMDQAVNERGFRLDRGAIAAALAIIDAHFTDLNAELVALTGGKVERATQRQRMLDWLEEDHAVVLEDTRAATLDDVLATWMLDATPRRGIEIMRTLGKSSTAKFVKMANWICPDDRVHGGMLFHGASTGRWSGQGIQPHNFPRGRMSEIKSRYGIVMEDTWDILQLIHRRSS